MNIGDIIEAIEAKRVLLTSHAKAEAEEDGLEFDTIYYSVFEGEIIKDYPEDRPCPSCLVLGMTASGEPVHSVWGYDQGKQIAILITVYRPESDLWIDWRIRRNISGSSS